MTTPSPNTQPNHDAEPHAFDTRLLERIERRSKWAGFVVLIGAAIVLASFGATPSRTQNSYGPQLWSASEIG